MDKFKHRWRKKHCFVKGDSIKGYAQAKQHLQARESSGPEKKKYNRARGKQKYNYNIGLVALISQ